MAGKMAITVFLRKKIKLLPYKFELHKNMGNYTIEEICDREQALENIYEI